MKQCVTTPLIQRAVHALHAGIKNFAQEAKAVFQAVQRRAPIELEVDVHEHGIEFCGENFGTVIVTIAIHGVAVIVSIVVIAVAIRGVVIVIVAPKTFQRVHQVQSIPSASRQQN